MRKRRCRRPDTTSADFGTGSGPFSSLVSLCSSLPAGWPCTRATSRASSSRLFDTATFFRQDTIVGVVLHWSRSLPRTHSRRALGVWRRGLKSSSLEQLFIYLRGTSCVTRLRYPYQLTTTASAIHPEIAIQLCQGEAFETLTEHENHETSSG